MLAVLYEPVITLDATLPNAGPARTPSFSTQLRTLGLAVRCPEGR
jgi:hypothetical protein